MKHKPAAAPEAAPLPRIPGTLREYTRKVVVGAVTIYRTRFGWQVPMRDIELWLATHRSLKRATAFVARIAAEGGAAFAP